MRRVLDSLYMAGGVLAAVCVLLITLLMIGQSVLREFGVPTGATNDVVAWLCAAAAFLGMAHTFKHGDFVRVTLLMEKLSPVSRHRLELSCLSVAILAVGYLAWWASRFVWESWEFNDVANGLLAVPMWIPQLSFVAGAWLLWLAVLDEWWVVWRGERPSYEVAIAERHAQGDFSSDI